MVYLFLEVYHTDHSDSYVDKSVFSPFVCLSQWRATERLELDCAVTCSIMFNYTSQKNCNISLIYVKVRYVC